MSWLSGGLQILSGFTAGCVTAQTAVFNGALLAQTAYSSITGNIKNVAPGFLLASGATFATYITGKTVNYVCTPFAGSLFMTAGKIGAIFLNTLNISININPTSFLKTTIIGCAAGSLVAPFCSSSASLLVSSGSAYISSYFIK